jgi:hypothetical protein
MIIGQALGDVVSEQSTTDTKGKAVKKMQQVMQSISAMTGNANYAGDTSGRVGMKTTHALYVMGYDGLAEIPIISWITDKLKNAPGIGHLLDALHSRSTFDAAWTILKYLPGEDELGQWLKENIITPIRTAAASAEGSLNLVLDQLQPGGGGGGEYIFDPLVVKFDYDAVKYPEGTVAIRDPILGKYRLIAPVK